MCVSYNVDSKVVETFSNLSYNICMYVLRVLGLDLALKKPKKRAYPLKLSMLSRSEKYYISWPYKAGFECVRLGQMVYVVFVNIHIQTNTNTTQI